MNIKKSNILPYRVAHKKWVAIRHVKINDFDICTYTGATSKSSHIACAQLMSNTTDVDLIDCFLRSDLTTRHILARLTSCPSPTGDLHEKK